MQTDTDEDDFVVVETDAIPEDEEPQAEAPEPEAEPEGDDGEDERLGDEDDEEGDDEETLSRNRAKRQKRRQAQKAARQKLEAELRAQRDINAKLFQKVNELEGAYRTQSDDRLHNALRAAQDDYHQAERIIARAVEAGNGDDVTAAINIRDEARYRAAQLAQEIEQQKAVRQAAPSSDPIVAAYAQQWMEANKAWYNPNGSDAASVAARRIDGDLIREGFDPKTPDYYFELTSRVEAAFGQPAKERAPVRRPPPMGATREHAPPATRRNEVFVTPERRAALEELGVWDDPVARKRYLKAYAEHDRAQAATRR